MKTLILFVIGLLVVGCGNNEQTSNTNEGNNTPAKSVTKKAEKETPSIGTKAKSPKEIPEEDVIGSYELPDKRGPIKLNFLENGKVEFHPSVGIKEDGTWKIVRKEVHVSSEGGPYEVAVCKIEPNGDLTFIAYIDDGKRQEATKEFQEFQTTYKKIK